MAASSNDSFGLKIATALSIALAVVLLVAVYFLNSGYNQEFEKNAAAQKKMAHYSGAYHEAVANSVLLDGRRVTYMDLINRGVITSVSMNGSAASIERSTWLSAARLNTTRGLCSASSLRTSARSPMSPLMKT